MYCSHCGAEAANRFCSQCGRPLDVKLQIAESLNNSSDWHHEFRYSVLLHFSEVRDLIAASASHASKPGMTGEQILELVDKAYVPLVGVSLSTVSSIILPIYTRIGIKTGKQRSERIAQPVGVVTVNTICSLARYGRTLKEVHQASDGCVIEATLPSDIWSFAGELLISIHQHEQGTQVEAATKIPGQFFDWGKSVQCLQQLFSDLQIVTASAA